jgi:hypothetical protein
MREIGGADEASAKLQQKISFYEKDYDGSW